MFERLYDKLSALPVASAADKIADSVLTPCVTVLSAETGSGKTLYATAKLAEKWQKMDKNGQGTVVVLVPRRFLAMNAASTIAELSGAKIGETVGYAVGRRPGDESCFSDKTKLLFTTYGYALTSKLLNSASVVVLDEVHERDLDIATARALLRHRPESGEDVKVLEMSATINAQKQAAYWNVNGTKSAQIFNVEGKTYPCERRQKSGDAIPQAVMELLEEGKKGILVFRPGLAEIRETTKLLTQACEERGINVEIEQIFGEMGPEDRKRALRAPSGNTAKILIGTNVIESGANIPWVDAGVSCGTGKQKNVDLSGTHSLDLELLPKWRLIQQEGRVKRFKPGVFVLASDIGWDARPLETKPELERLPITDILMQVVRFNLDPRQLTFDPPLDPQRVEKAKKELIKLGLIDENFKPTEAGKFASSMPLSAEAGAMLWHAKKLGVLKAALPLAAVMMSGGIRFQHRYPHRLDDTSDLMDSLKAFLTATKWSDRGTMERLNINYQKYLSTYALFEGLAKTVNRMPDCDRQQSVALESELRQCILAGKLNQLFKIEEGELTSPHHENRFRLHDFSTVTSTQDKDYAVGRLSVSNPGGERPVTRAEDVTLLYRYDLLELARARPEMIKLTKQDITRNSTSSEKIMKLEFRFTGEEVPFDVMYSKEDNRARVRGRT